MKAETVNGCGSTPDDVPMLNEANIKKENGVKDKPRRFQDSLEDPIVHEIPVFLAKSLASQLFLLQYPVRPCQMSYDTSTVVSSRVKPRQKKLEITVSLNTDCPSFDSSKGEQIALNVDGCDAKEMSEENSMFPEKVMDRLVLSSTKSVLDTSRYAVGILDANEFHVTPLEGILSLRPSLEFLDKSDKTAKAEGRGLLTENEEDADDPTEEETSQVKAVTVRFARGSKTEQERVEKIREKSFEYQQKKAMEEPWVNLKYNHLKTDKWTTESQKLFCKHMDDEVKAFSVKCGEYLGSLN